MKTGRIYVLPLIFIFCFGLVRPASAHLPYLERDRTEIVIDDPAVSKAYYGWLTGAPAIYAISSAKPFLLYLNILSPHDESSKMDYSANIYKDGELLASVNGGDAIWLQTYEPFANDYYSKGPEYEAPAVAGDYKIEVFNSGNSGNYILAVGKAEDLSLGQFLRTLWVLPKVKQEFFGRPWWEAFNNFIGLFAFIMLAVFGVILYFAISFIRRYRLKKRLDHEFNKNNRANR